MSETHVGSNGRKYLLLAIFFVFLTFPQVSHEFNFQFGGGGDDDADVKQPIKKLDKKFKFHKIERVYHAGDHDQDEDYYDAAAVNGEEEDAAARAAAADDSAAADSGMRNEDEEYQFQRGRKMPREKSTNKARNEEPQQSSSPTFFSSLFGGLFGGGAKSSDKAEAKAKEQSMALIKSNSIIDWLTWIGEKSGRLKPPPPPEPSPSSFGLLSYFNRWPFNTFFPIGQPEKPIRMPRRSGMSGGRYDDTSDNAVPPMSQEHFDSLLHTLPGFVVNASHVADIECRQQLQIFNRQLRGNKLWTLQMLDATGKITSGLLRGNINQFGDFDLCTQIKTVVKVTSDIPVRIRGKYCLAHIEMQTNVPALKVPVHLAHGRGLWNSHLGNPSHFVPRYAVANWGICVPHMCSGRVVQEMIETNLRPYNTTGVEFHIETDDNDCFMRKSNRFTKVLKKDGKFGVTFLYILLLVILILASFLYEHWTIIKEFIMIRLKRNNNNNEANGEDGNKDNTNTDESEDANKKEEEQQDAAEESTENDTKADITEEEQASADPTGDTEEVTEEEQVTAPESENISIKFLLQEIFKSFSPKRTFNELLAQDNFDVQFPIFHALKLGATFMLYICLKFLMIGHLPITNRDKLVRAVDQPLSVIFRAPLIYMDIFLTISGFLSAYQLYTEMEQKNYIHLLKRVAAKAVRYLPTVYVVLLFQTFILPYLGSGPLWTNLIGQNARLCEQQMWRNFFSVQNAIDFEETCSPMTIQLGLEVQLYLLGPLLVWLYYTDADAGFYVYGAIHAMSVAARFSRTQREHLSITFFHGMNVSKFYRTANILYSSPISRATPYLLGLGCGILHRSQEGSLYVAPELVPIGWLLAALSIFWCFWSPSSGMRSDFIYTSSDAASYAAWSPLILGLALCWIIFMFPKDENSLVRFLTSTRPVLFFSRIAFPMQLAMYVVVLYNTAIVKESLKYHVTDLINFSEIGTIIIFAIILAFLIDVPCKNVHRLIVNRLFIERPHQEAEQEPVSGAEQSEVSEVSEDRSENATCDTPEPPDTIWSSDPEEEEQKYIERRRSSTTIDSDDVAKIQAAAASAAETATEKPTAKADDDVTVKEEEVEEEEEEEVESDIAEEQEVKKRPASPAKQVEVETKKEPVVPTTRRRRPTSED